MASVSTKLSKPAPYAYRELTDEQRRKLIQQRYLLAVAGAAMLAEKRAA